MNGRLSYFLRRFEKRGEKKKVFQKRERKKERKKAYRKFGMLALRIGLVSPFLKFHGVSMSVRVCIDGIYSPPLYQPKKEGICSYTPSPNLCFEKVSTSGYYPSYPEAAPSE